MSAANKKPRRSKASDSHRGDEDAVAAVFDASLANFFDCAAAPMLVIDQKGTILAANDASSQLLSRPAKELCGQQEHELLRPTPFGPSHPPAQGPLAEAQTIVECQRPDGIVIALEARTSRLPGGRHLLILRDVSHQVAADEILQSSSSAFSAVSELCHNPVIIANSDGRIQAWNPAAEALFGYTASEAIGMPIQQLVPADLRALHDAGFNRHTEANTDFRFGRSIFTRALCKEGSEVPVEISIGVGKRGSSLVFTAVVRDMTEHRHMVERLNDALQRLQFHVERMPLAYIVWDSKFRIVDWNPAAERIFGYAREEAIGRHAYELLVPPDAISAVEEVWNDLLHGHTSSHSINANVRKDGSRLTCEWFNTPLRDSSGRIRGVASMAMDVSERERLEAQIRHAQKLESLGVMAGGIAHDFNSSLMVILGNASLLRSIKGLPPKALQHIDLIEQAGQRANELIKHMLAYARTGRHNPVPTDLNRVIRDAMSFVQSSIGKGHRVALELADGLPQIHADRSQVEQILLNLCINARQAMPDGGTISIRTRFVTMDVQQAAKCVPLDAKPGSYVEIRVRDTGCGIEPAAVSRIFDPFFTTKPDGHGLGLAAVLGILRQHRAMARVESTVGEGTAMHVYFPVT